MTRPGAAGPLGLLLSHTPLDGNGTANSFTAGSDGLATIQITVPNRKDNTLNLETHVKIIPPEEATGELKRVYDKIQATRGTIAPVQMTMSLRPDIMEKMSELRSVAHFRDGLLTRRQHELIATYASALRSGKRKPPPPPAGSEGLRARVRGLRRGGLVAPAWEVNVRSMLFIANPEL